jgi:tRNA pseudouridine55 synthase
MDGILLVDKPAGYTSHDIVAIVKRAYRLQKVGHTGTLDPLATGLLPLCINKATRLAGQFINADKAYETTIRWGIETDTYDAEGKIVHTANIPKDVVVRLQQILPEFRGTIQQQPPPYSAIKVAGKPLYWWARKGDPKTVPDRAVTVHDIQITATTAETATLRVACSKGTFIRSLAHDMGKRLGCGGHVMALRRTRTGEFDVKNAVSLEEIKKAAPDGAAFEKWLIPLDQFTRLIPAP